MIIRSILLLTYVPLLLEIIRSSYEPMADGLGQLTKYTGDKITQMMVCRCRVCEERRKLNLNTFH